MTNELAIFQNEDFGTVRTLFIKEEPWFVAMDVAERLGYAETANMRKLLEPDEYMEIDPQSVDFTGFVQNGRIDPQTHRMLLINESGFYNAIFHSTKKEAKAFRKWVTSEILPSIRKTGVYLPEEAMKQIQEIQSELASYKNRVEALEDKTAKTDTRLGIIESGTVLWEPSPWVADMLERLEFIRHFYRDRNGNFSLRKMIGYFIQEARLDLEPVRKVMMRETKLDREPRALEIIDYDENLQWRFTCKVQKAYEEFDQPYYKDDMSFLDAIEVIRM